ncbi:MAG: type II toxin-antitoxin system RelE/ParE family toxin [Burkholderiales bacterium]
MARIELSSRLDEDFERIIEHLESHEVSGVAARVLDILHALDVLERNPQIGRPVREGLRELVIGRDSRGYVALYRYVAEVDTVFVLALRGQKESGYTMGSD